jgi:hypothetical protein
LNILALKLVAFGLSLSAPDVQLFHVKQLKTRMAALGDNVNLNSGPLRRRPCFLQRITGGLREVWGERRAATPQRGFNF